MSSLDRARIDRLLNAEDPLDAAERGVTYEFLERLLHKQKLTNLTTRQVVKQYVVPQTFNSKCSLSGLLRQVHPQSVGRATHYVVHPWDGSFERLVSALGAVDGSHDDEEGNPPYFWIDVFALNQRQQVEGYKREEDTWLHRDEMFAQLKQCMRSIDKICVIVDPVPNPIVVKRAWCLFECAQALHQGREVMLCPVPEPPDCDPFLSVVYDFEHTISNYKIQFSEAEATIPIDKEWLQKEVHSVSPLAEKWLNERVSKELLGWLGDRAAGRVLATNFSESTEDETLSDEAVEKRLMLMQSLNRLLASLDRPEKAREIIERAVARAQELYGPEDERTLSMRHDLACLSAKSFGELKKADQQLRQILASRQKLHGDDHPMVVESMEALARVLKERRKLTEAISLFKKVLAIREKTLGSRHFQTLVTMNILALTLQKREHYKEAERVFRRVVTRGIDTLGATNMDVMVWSNNLAVLYQDTKQLEKAEVVLRTTLRNAEHAIGPTHEHTLTLVFNLGFCLWSQGRLRAAEGFFRRELAGCEATKGLDHRDTQRSRQNLARFIASQLGREKEAEAVLRGETRGPEENGHSSSPPAPEGAKKSERRVAISNPEVQQVTPKNHGHLVKVAAGLSALPPPRGVGGPRKSSAEWSDSASLPKDYATSTEYRGSYAASPTSDGDDRTADDTTGEDRSSPGGQNLEEYYYEDEDGIYDDEDEEGYFDDDLLGEGEDEYYEENGYGHHHEEEEEGEGEDHIHHHEHVAEESEEGSYYDDGHVDDDAVLDEIVGDDMGTHEDEEDNQANGLNSEEDDFHDYNGYQREQRFGSKETMGSKEEYSEEEDVVAFEESSISDSIHPRGRGRSSGRERREQTVTSDDELLAEQFRESEEEEVEEDEGDSDHEGAQENDDEEETKEENHEEEDEKQDS